MCSSMLSLKFFVYSKSHSAHSENRDQRMRQLVAYKGLKTMENINRQAPKMVLVAYGRWLFTRGSNCKALTVFSIGGRLWGWSLTRGGRTWGSTVFGKSRGRRPQWRSLSLIVGGEWWGTVW